MLVKDWKSITLTSYTAIAFYALALITLAPDAIYFIFELDTNPRVWSVLQILTIIGGLIGRLLLQPHEGRWVRRAVILAVICVVSFFSYPALAMSVSIERSGVEVVDNEDAGFDEVSFNLISRWEGKRNAAYFDIVGVPTICYGHTRTVTADDVRNNRTMTDAQCRRLLVSEIAEYREGWHGYLSAETVAQRLTVKRDAAYTSLAFNVGIRGAGKSTATRRLNSGDVEGGCHAIGWWNKAGGRVVRGLVNRRSEEVALCLEGIN